MAEITLAPLTAADREQFISDNQEAFNYGALEEFGRRDDHFEEEGEIISRQVIEASIDGGEAYRILADGQPVGGAVILVIISMTLTLISICCSYPPRSTAGASATPPGAPSSSSTRR